jgi:hypothetical protein
MKLPTVRFAAMAAALLLWAMPSDTSGATCFGDADIFFVNGVANTFKKAEASKFRLEEVVTHAVGPDCKAPLVLLAYNRTAGPILDLLQAFTQLREVSDDDPVLLEHVDLYRGTMGGARKAKAIVVAHSQGNLYANKAFAHLAADPSLDVNRRFAIVGVATPASFVASSGPPYSYVTLTEDKVASVIFPLVNATVLRPNTSNTTNPFVCRDRLLNSHCFVTSYLDGAKSGPKISELVLAAIPPSVNGGDFIQAYIVTDHAFAGQLYVSPQTLAASRDRLTITPQWRYHQQGTTST